MTRSLVPSLVALCAGAALAAPALAAPAASAAEKVTWTVRLGDVDMHTSAGARAAAFRINQAASYVCGGDSILIRRGSGFLACRQRAIGRALARIAAPQVDMALGFSPATGLAQR